MKISKILTAPFTAMSAGLRSLKSLLSSGEDKPQRLVTSQYPNDKRPHHLLPKHIRKARGRAHHRKGPRSLFGQRYDLIRSKRIIRGIPTCAETRRCLRLNMRLGRIT